MQSNDSPAVTPIASHSVSQARRPGLDPSRAHAWHCTARSAQKVPLVVLPSADDGLTRGSGMRAPQKQLLLLVTLSFLCSVDDAKEGPIEVPAKLWSSSTWVPPVGTPTSRRRLAVLRQKAETEAVKGARQLQESALQLVREKMFDGTEEKRYTQPVGIPGTAVGELKRRATNIGEPGDTSSWVRPNVDDDAGRDEEQHGVAQFVANLPWLSWVPLVAMNVGGAAVFAYGGVVLERARWKLQRDAAGETLVGLSDLTCPITCEVMLDPVCTAIGSTYERTAIMEWLRTHSTDPATNTVLTSKRLVPNTTLRTLARASQRSLKRLRG